MKPDLFTGRIGNIDFVNCTFDPIEWSDFVLETVSEYDPTLDEVDKSWTWGDLAEYRGNEALAMVEAGDD